MIKEKYMQLLTRGIPEKKVKYRESPNHLSYQQKTELYQYYICDCCGEEIRINNKWEKSKGGVILLPKLLTKKQPITIAVCNKCLDRVLKEFDEVS